MHLFIFFYYQGGWYVSQTTCPDVRWKMSWTGSIAVNDQLTSVYISTQTFSNFKCTIAFKSLRESVYWPQSSLSSLLLLTYKPFSSLTSPVISLLPINIIKLLSSGYRINQLQTLGSQVLPLTTKLTTVKEIQTIFWSLSCVFCFFK